MTKSITVFTTSTCSYCPMVKRYLQSKGLAYDEVNLEDHPDIRAELYEKYNAMTVPITVIKKADDTERVVVGFKMQELVPALA